MTATLLAVAGLCLVGGFVALAYRRRWAWTGFTAARSGDASSKTLWDWLQLLVIPVALAGVAFALNAWQSAREQDREDSRARHERAITAERGREDVLRAYLDQMSGLMLRGGLLGSRRRNDAVRWVARTATLTALRRLDPARKGLVVQFLGEAGLIQAPEPKVHLAGADLRGTPLADSFLPGVEFSQADLRGADFSRAELEEVSFRASDLRGANFNRATLEPRTPAELGAPVPEVIALDPFDLARPGEGDVRQLDLPSLRTRRTGVDFSEARLSRARFRLAYLSRPDFTRAKLDHANFRGAILASAKFQDTDLRHADFSAAYVGRAHFWLACLTGARFVRANLLNARLDGMGRDVDFSQARLEGVRADGARFTRLTTRGATGIARLPKEQAPLVGRAQGAWCFK